MKDSIAIVITAYHPDKSFLQKCENFVNCGFGVVIFDNTPGGSEIFPKNANLESMLLIQHGINYGLPIALNTAINKSAELGYEYALLLDQDTTPSKVLIENLYKSYLLNTQKKNSIVVMAPIFSNSSTLEHLDDEKCTDIKQVSCVPTAGMFMSIRDWMQIPHFSEDFFLDFVDFEWCWRIATTGAKFYVNHNLKIEQKLGIGQRKFLGVNINIPVPFRHYFQFRDTLNILFKSYVPLKSKLRFLGVLPLKIILYPFLLSNGSARFMWMIQGIIDFFLKKKGVGSAKKITG